MKEEISIKVNIADVTYPLKIAVQDEENVRKAAKMINEKVKSYREDYQIADKANLLSMVALEFASELLYYKDRNFIEDNGISEGISKLNRILDENL